MHYHHQYQNREGTSAEENSSGMTIGQIVGGKYRLEEKLGQGSFGMIFKCVSVDNSEQYAIKLEKRNKRHSSMLVREIKVMMELKNEFGYARMISYGKEEDYNYVVMTHLGKNLDSLLKKCGQRFSLTTSMNIAEQMITRLEMLHSHNLIHRDVKPENFVIGSDRNFHLIYLIDFGLAKYFKDSEGNHIPVVEKKGMIGTARYASINAHLGLEQSRRDDLEALGYVLLYFIRGKLPWQQIQAENKEEKYEKIKNMKMNFQLEQMCEGCPYELVQYFRFVKKLEFTEQPNYAQLKALFRKVLTDKKLDTFSLSIDWENLPDYRHKKKNLLLSDLPVIPSQKEIAQRQQSRQVQLQKQQSREELNPIKPSSSKTNKKIASDSQKKLPSHVSPQSKPLKLQNSPTIESDKIDKMNQNMSKRKISDVSIQVSPPIRAKQISDVGQAEKSVQLDQSNKMNSILSNNYHNFQQAHTNQVLPHIFNQEQMAESPNRQYYSQSITLPIVTSNINIQNIENNANNSNQNINNNDNINNNIYLGSIPQFASLNSANLINNGIPSLNMVQEKRSSLAYVGIVSHSNNLLIVPSNQGSLSQASITGTSKINNYSASDSETILDEGGIMISTPEMISRNVNPLSTSEIRRDIRSRSLIIQQSQLEIADSDLNYRLKSIFQIEKDKEKDIFKKNVSQVSKQVDKHQVKDLSFFKADIQNTREAILFQQSGRQGEEGQGFSSKSSFHQSKSGKHKSSTSQINPSTDEIKEHQDEENNSNTKYFRQYKTQITPITEVKDSTNKSRTRNSRASFIGENVTETIYENPIIINSMHIQAAFHQY